MSTIQSNDEVLVNISKVGDGIEGRSCTKHELVVQQMPIVSLENCKKAEISGAKFVEFGRYAMLHTQNLRWCYYLLGV